MLKLVVFAVLVVSAMGMIVCPQNICTTIKCSTPIVNCKGIIKPDAGWCGCCDLCVTQLAEGESCLGEMLIGVPHHEECAPGLYCDTKTMKCTADRWHNVLRY